MDHTRFDALSKSLGATRLTRSRLLAGLLGGVLLAVGQGGDSDAHQRARRRRRRQRRGAPQGIGSPFLPTYPGRCLQISSPKYSCVCVGYDGKPCVTSVFCYESSGICQPDHGRCECLGQPPVEPPPS